MKIYRGTQTVLGCDSLAQMKNRPGVYELVLTALPVEWQLTVLPGYAILYQETIDYQTALAWWRSTTTGAVETPGPAHTAPPTNNQLLFTDESECQESSPQ